MPTDPMPPNSDHTIKKQHDPASAEPPPTGGGSVDSGGVTAPLPTAVASCSLAVPGFEIIGELGRGGMGVVYRARQSRLNRIVALKMILARRDAGLQECVRFQIEAEAVARLQHPNIVQIYEIGEQGGLPFFALEYCDGGSLDRKLSDWQTTPAEAGELVETLARAMHYAHVRGVVHRDLKPANVLLSACGLGRNAKPQAANCKITDFGLAKQLDTSSGVSQMGAVLGTPSYMAPERAAGCSHDTGPATDVYALGAILYELLTGRPPFRGPTALVTIRQVLMEEPVPPSRQRRGLSLDLEMICLKCLKKEPSRRYTTAEALADDLRRYRHGEPVAARPLGPLERAGRWVRRRPAAAGLLAAMTTLVVVVLVSLGLVSQQLRQTQEALADKDREHKDRVESDRKRALAQVSALQDAAPGAVPGILAELEAARADVLPRLRELWAAGDQGNRGRRMRLALALLPVEPNAVRDELVSWMLRADDPGEVLLARDALRPHENALRPRLWEIVGDATTKPDERFRALAALAAFDPEGAFWAQQASAAAEQILASNSLHVGSWVSAFRPVQAALLKPLEKLYHTAPSLERREIAATVLADYAGNRPDVLADLLLDADARQFAVLFPKLRAFATTAELLRQELIKKPVPDWKNAPLDPDWPPVAAAVRQEIEMERQGAWHTENPNAGYRCQARRSSGFRSEGGEVCLVRPARALGALGRKRLQRPPR